MMNRLSKVGPRGFTLVELLIVIAIVGILVTIVVIAIDPARVIQNSQDTKRRTELNQVKTALQLYYNENKDYPTSAEFTATTGSSPPNFVNTYIRQMPSSVTAANYTPNATNQDYTIWTSINHESSDDQNSHTKCGQAGSPPAAGGAGRYWVCPD